MDVVSAPEQPSKSAVRVTHPIGVGASPFENQHTEANREALSQCLHLYYHDALEPRCTQPYGERGTGRTAQHSDTGLELSARLTSKLELDLALGKLKAARRDLWQVIHRFYGLDQSKALIEHHLHLRHGEAAKRIEAGIDFMIPIVFYDYDNKH